MAKDIFKDDPSGIGHNNPPADEQAPEARIDPNMLTAYEAVGNREDLS